MLFILIQLIKNNIIIIINISKKEQSLEIFAVSYTAAHHTYLPNFSVKSKQTSKKFYSLSTPPLARQNTFAHKFKLRFIFYNLIFKRRKHIYSSASQLQAQFFAVLKKRRKETNNIYFFYKSKENFQHISNFLPFSAFNCSSP